MEFYLLLIYSKNRDFLMEIIYIAFYINFIICNVSCETLGVLT